MTKRQLKSQICEIGRRLYNRGFAAANDGNISVRLNDREILCTPTMVSKGFMEPSDICKVDYDGKQLAGKKRRSSEVLLHLSVYKSRPDVHAVVHCHPPHATAFAVAHEPIPKGVLAEVEVFLGEVPMSVYETPGGQRFADTILPYTKDCNTIILANHGTVTFGPDLQTAYFNTEIIDAYCRILILARQLGRINYFTPQQMRELLELKKRMGFEDLRFDMPDSELCQDNIIARGQVDFCPQPHAFNRPEPSRNGTLGEKDIEKLVCEITQQVLAALDRKNNHERTKNENTKKE
jgi:L-fuculose-phosphate aldolase